MWPLLNEIEIPNRPRGDRSKQTALSEIKGDLRQLDEHLEAMLAMKPEFAESYRAQHWQAEREIEQKILGLELTAAIDAGE